MRIFICYRQQDKPEIVAAIHQALINEFGDSNIFRDIRITIGEDIRAKIQNTLTKVDVVLVVIGEKWLTLTNNQGIIKLYDPDDYVKMEVDMALHLNNVKAVIPVFIDDAPIPTVKDLPASISQLPLKLGKRIETQNIDSGIGVLIQEIKKIEKKPLLIWLLTVVSIFLLFILNRRLLFPVVLMMSGVFLAFIVLPDIKVSLSNLFNSTPVSTQIINLTEVMTLTSQATTATITPEATIPLTITIPVSATTSEIFSAATNTSIPTVTDTDIPSLTSTSTETPLPTATNPPTVDITLEFQSTVQAITKCQLADVDHNGIVDGNDYSKVLDALTSKPGEANYNLDFDINRNGVIDGEDALLVLSMEENLCPLLERMTDCQKADVNNDNQVTTSDHNEIVNLFGVQAGNEAFKESHDIDRNGVINGNDGEFILARLNSVCFTSE